MKRLFWGITIAFLVFAVPAGSYWWFLYGRNRPATQKDSRSVLEKETQSGPIACVKTVPIRKGTITEHIVVYGSVIPAPGALRAVSIPFESQIITIMVSDGQKVAEGDALLRIQPSPDTMLQLQQAGNAYKLQQESLQQMQRRFDLRLATNEQLLQARQALEQAKLRLESLTKRGVDGTREITASVAGLIKKVYVQEGAIVSAGNPLMEIVAQNRVEVRLGVEPEDIDRVHSGQAVSLTRVNAPHSPAASGQVRKISYAVNPATRLVDVFVALPSTTGFLLGDFISGKIAINVAQGLIVPRSAVLLTRNGFVLYTIKDNRAVEHIVSIGIENPKEYQVLGEELQSGEPVVVEGNYELTNGMAVVVEACQ